MMAPYPVCLYLDPNNLQYNGAATTPTSTHKLRAFEFDRQQSQFINECVICTLLFNSISNFQKYWKSHESSDVAHVECILALYQDHSRVTFLGGTYDIEFHTQKRVHFLRSSVRYYYLPPYSRLISYQN